MTLYDLKPRFQALLRPLLRWLYQIDVTANQVTLSALIASTIIGCLLIFIPEPKLFLILPFFLFIRMALNAIDGLLAREYKQQSKLGAILNEVGDVVSDSVLYLPFAFLPFAQSWLVVITVLLCVLSEFCGLLTQTIGATRRYDGPMGKSDRAFVFGVYGLSVAIFPQTLNWSSWIFASVAILLVITCVNRCRKGLKQVAVN
ncbi:CDP-alcohol phosphatidyltransferase family protein [Orbaceae bacterium ac157xtp]